MAIRSGTSREEHEAGGDHHVKNRVGDDSVEPRDDASVPRDDLDGKEPAVH